MTYVEWLRVRAALKWTVVVLGALVLIALVLRVSLLAFGKDDALSFVNGMETDANSRVAHSTLPDGTRRTTVDNAKEDVHIVIDDSGYQGKRITIYESSSHGKRHAPKTIEMGSLNVQSTAQGQETVTTIETNQPESFAYYAAIATFIALIVATVLGAPFARENDGHLEIALTKPIDRSALALQTIGVDLLGILAAWAVAVIALVVGHSIFEAPHFIFRPVDATIVVLGLVGVTAWYAMLCAATASMRRAFGVVLGLSWPVSALVVLFARLPLQGSALGQVVHAIATPFAWINPFFYLHFGPAVTVDGQPKGSLAVDPLHELPALAILALIYLALAVWQWRRVEA
ncbi:MAG TPA: ABC transporter permease [Candidatus Tumulicola sp.]|nr:ABC transporter permease [Candidatus Tumulicola sp.]